MLVKLTRYFLSLTSSLVDSFCLSIVLHYDCFFYEVLFGQRLSVV